MRTSTARGLGLAAMVVMCCGLACHKVQATADCRKWLSAISTDMRLRPISIPAVQNMALAVDEIKLAPNIGDLSPGPPGPMTRSWAVHALEELKATDSALDQIVRASHLPAWKEPESMVTASRFPKFANVKLAMKLLELRAEARATVGATGGAMRDLEAGERIADAFVRGSNTAISWLVAVAIQAIDDRGLGRVVASGRLDASEVAALLDLLPPASSGDSSLSNAMRGNIRSTIDDLFSSWPAQPSKTPPSDDWNPKRMVGALCDGTRLGVKNLDRSWAKQEPLEPFIRSLAEPEGKSPDGIDNVDARDTVKDLLSLIPRICELSFTYRTRLEAVRASLALRIWALGHRGQYPEKLQQLVSAGILPSEPRDLFGGQALRYDRARMILWSVGPDGRDNGGIGKPGFWNDKSPDYVWPVGGFF